MIRFCFLVVIALVLIGLVSLGVGAGIGVVQINSHGIAFVHKAADSPEQSSDQPRVVSPDELLRLKHVTYVEPASKDKSTKTVDALLAQSAAPAADVAAATKSPAPSNSDAELPRQK